MAVSVVSICNRALARVAQGPIVNIDDGDRLSRLCKLHFGPARDALLRSTRWKFSLARADLPALSAAPAFGWDYAYAIPVDSLRVLSVNDLDPERDPNEGDQWDREGDTIVTNEPPTIQIRYIRQITDPTRFDAAFVDALVLRLAMDLSPSIKELDAELTLSLRRELEHVLEQARHTSQIEGQFHRVYRTRSTWLQGRSYGRG